jgi:hypothetical protein
MDAVTGVEQMIELNFSRVRRLTITDCEWKDLVTLISLEIKNGNPCELSGGVAYGCTAISPTDAPSSLPLPANASKAYGKLLTENVALTGLLEDAESALRLFDHHPSVYAVLENIDSFFADRGASPSAQADETPDPGDVTEEQR